jgi:hypothetical protein
MTTDTLHPLAADCLERLRRAGRRLAPGRRRELLAEIEGHLSEAIDPGASDAQALTVLDKLGDVKWIGTLLIPGGLATAFVALIALGGPDKKLCSGFPGGAQDCTNAAGSSAASSILEVALLVFLVLAPIATAIYLAAMTRRDRIRL